MYLSTAFGWDFWQVGGFLASWIIGYGIVQSLAPRLTGKARGHVPDGRAALAWATALAGVPALIALGLTAGAPAQVVLLGGLMLFGVLFAVNSSLHSYLIVSYAKEDGVSLDVGFYYMSNALGRLIGTLLSGWVFQAYGLQACLWISCAFVLLAALISVALPRHAKGLSVRISPRAAVRPATRVTAQDIIECHVPPYEVDFCIELVRHGRAHSTVSDRRCRLDRQNAAGALPMSLSVVSPISLAQRLAAPRPPRPHRSSAS